MRKLSFGVLGSLLGLMAIAVLALGFWPVPPDVPTLGAGGKAGAPAPPSGPDLRGSGEILVVHPDQSIQAAVDRARPGDVIRVMPGSITRKLRSRQTA